MHNCTFENNIACNSDNPSEGPIAVFGDTTGDSYGPYNVTNNTFKNKKQLISVNMYSRRVSLTNSHSSSYLFRDNNSSEVIYSSHNSSCFHIYKNLLALQICTVSICKTRRFMLLFQKIDKSH